MLETARFFHQFAVLLNAGIPMQQSLGMAGRDCSAKLQRSLKEASLKVAAGQDLATALNASPYFNAWTIALIRLAEYSGSLADTFERLAIATETQHRRQKLYGSVLVSSVVIGFAVLALFIALISRSTAFVLQPVFWVLMAIVAMVLLFRGRLLTRASVTTGQQLMSHVPFLKGIAQARSILYFTELELPLRCGVPLLQALELLRSHVPDVALRTSLTIASRQIQAGQTLSQSLTGLPSLALQMLRTGEETGNLDEMLGKLADYCESDLERQLKQLQATLQPLGLLAAGILVLLIGLQAITSTLKALPG